MQGNKYDIELLCGLSDEIARDGGASLVRDLKDYLPRIETLLKKKASKTKLLAFLEHYPTTFTVDRDRSPHFVYLTSNEFVGRYTLAADTSDVLPPSDCVKKALLEDRIMCILKKEASKDIRRSRTNTTSGVDKIWLLKQCKRSCHDYLRAFGFYQQTYSDGSNVKTVGSSDWIEVVMDAFMSVVQDTSLVQGNRIHLKEVTESTLDTKHMAQKLIDAVIHDGGTHISLSLLLHRCPALRPILSGYDLIKLKEEQSELFKEVNIFSRNNEVYLQSTILREGRMLVDETGLFSVASSKWGNAFATLMANSCVSVLSQNISETIAIDLTASVGGVTLSLSRKFREVVAIEIDPLRAELCNQNMKNHGCDNVIVRCEDSVESIPSIGLEYRERPKVVVIDPPWGGMHYKREKDNQIMMGPWTMIEVVVRIAKHMSPTVIGFRMPIGFDSDTFLRAIKDAGTPCNAVDVRKAGPQLFIILSV